MSKFTRFLGRPNGPKICAGMIKTDFKDRASGAPQTVFFLKAHDVSYPNSDKNTNAKTNTDTNTNTNKNTKTNTNNQQYSPMM